MGRIGYGYGSEWHLLRWLGRHRTLLNEKVAEVSGWSGAQVEWLDFGFDSGDSHRDLELRGLDFLYGRYPELKEAWEGFWPTKGNVPN